MIEIRRGMREAALFNARLDIVVVTAFLTFVTIIIIGCALEWWRILSGAKKAVLHETTYMPLEQSGAAAPQSPRPCALT